MPEWLTILTAAALLLAAVMPWLMNRLTAWRRRLMQERMRERIAAHLIRNPKSLDTLIERLQSDDIVEWKEKPDGP